MPRSAGPTDIQLLALLERLEWPWNYGSPRCETCRSERPVHKPSCRMAKAIGGLRSRVAAQRARREAEARQGGVAL